MHDFNGGQIMKTLQFKCSLLSDVVLSASSASESVHESLDFIPGACFLGIVASSLYKSEDAHTYELFHSGAVRFGDAHLLCNGIRSSHVPSCLFYPKVRRSDDNWEFYVYHMIDNHGSLKDKQLKQCRVGYCAFSGANDALLLEICKDYALKSAYDSGRRRSEDEKMFGYESLCVGQEFAFEVEVENDGLAAEITSALCGTKHIGRSRSAQYGKVEIAVCSFENPQSCASNEDGLAVVYADGRLVFFDDNGMPNFRPTAQDLGFGSEAKIVYGKSQLRTFRYSPRNSKRNAFDSERCGFEKGSVFIVSGAAGVPSESYVGVYRNEGFGKVLYNPAFLSAATGSNGLSTLRFNEKRSEILCDVANPGTPLVKRLMHLRESSKNDGMIYTKVNEFVADNAGKFSGESFASQWGTIRGIAMSCKAERVYDEIEKYLGHGIAKDKWEERGRKNSFLEFLGNWRDRSEVLQDVAINLASQMAKESKKTR